MELEKPRVKIVVTLTVQQSPPIAISYEMVRELLSKPTITELHTCVTNAILSSIKDLDCLKTKDGTLGSWPIEER